MSNTSKISPSVKDFVLKAMEEINSDLDLTFCRENKVQFDNHEVNANDVELFTTESLDMAQRILGKK